ncbi:hypothetical protein [Paenibacillus alvei]|uniref:hypothetical protein n=1 Tax=Paenibacillus alvei TaxID=44250 RepID=UPI0018CD99F9|nr:hypothetical protein [Paenibacillus alvei]MBG9733561.1 hypothetical protein [Paenibacillus alvei]MBG9744866.1 hypothetical protein [Paenibacillus alvei]MCY9578678.1 hypothetical protein [Paenibacillus alvei]MCY9583737.1 hypothetical protein [Paenibacillus alvei]
MNMKKAILATMIVSSMLVAVAGPIPAGAEAAQEQKQTDNKKIQIDKTMAAKLQKAVKQFAGKEVKLQDAAESTFNTEAQVKSLDGKYVVRFDYKKGAVSGVNGTIPLDKISKAAQEKILKALNGAYAKKTYILDKEVVLRRLYDGKNEKLKDDYFSYQLTGKDFEANWEVWGKAEFVSRVVIKLAKEDIDSKSLEMAAKAIKTAFDHDFEITDAQLHSNGDKVQMLLLKDNDVSLEIDKKNGKVLNVYHNTRKKVTTDQEVTEKDAKEVIDPLAKELFNIDISGYEVKWDNLFKDYYFVKDKNTVLKAALDADKKPVYIISSGSGLIVGN